MLFFCCFLRALVIFAIFPHPRRVKSPSEAKGLASWRLDRVEDWVKYCKNYKARSKPAAEKQHLVSTTCSVITTRKGNKSTPTCSVK